MRRYWVLLLVLVVILGGAVGYLGYVYFGITKGGPTPVPQPLAQTPSPRLFTGTITELPYLPNDPYRDPDGPVLGLQADGGGYYALVGNIDATLEVSGQKVQIVGDIDPTVTIDHYDIKGVVRVTSMSALK